ncbi:MAG: VTT domain-containing protein [Oscillospiraceae bacterium]
MKKKKYMLSLILILPIACIALYYIIPLLRNITVQDILGYLPDNLYIAFWIIISLYALKSVSIFFPIIVLNIAVGSIYSLKMALLINTIGSIIAVTVPYLIGIICSEKWTYKLQKKFKKIDLIEQYRCNNQVIFTYLTRAVGFLPCDVLSWYMGNRHMNYFQYLIGSLLGMLPSMIINTIFGDRLANGVSKEIIILAAILIMISFFISFFSNKALQKIKRKN